MTRRSAGFVSKRPHKKSRGGCTTCKRKKVKCDEASPHCSYCKSRKLDCFYPHEQNKQLETPPSSEEETVYDEDFSSLTVVGQPLVPAVFTSSGQLTKSDLALLHQYKTMTFQTLTVREENVIHHLNREWVPQKSLSHSYLLYTILSITAAHSNFLKPSAESKHLANVYRQKTLASYNKALQNITNDNYETLLLTSLFLQVVIPPPALPCDDTVILDWVLSYLLITQGLRILAGLKWAAGIEKLDVFPVFRRELQSLPPPPDLKLPPDDHAYLYTRNTGPVGTTPEYPDPPAMYSNPLSSRPISSGVDMSKLPFRPKELMNAAKTNPDAPPSWKSSYRIASWQLPAPAFLPPSLIAFLRTLTEPNDTGPIDLHRATLTPVLHALSPIFLSLYYYRLNPDFYVRVITYPTFLMPEFHALVRVKEPRALVIMGWWFAFLRLLPNIWWVKDVIPRVLQSCSNVVIRSNSKILMDAVEGAFKVVRLSDTGGKEAAAKSIFNGWKGVYWGAEQSAFEDTIDWELVGSMSVST